MLHTHSVKTLRTSSSHDCVILACKPVSVLWHILKSSTCSNNTVRVLAIDLGIRAHVVVLSDAHIELHLRLLDDTHLRRWLKTTSAPYCLTGRGLQGA